MLFRLAIALGLIVLFMPTAKGDVVLFNVQGLITSVNQNGQNGTSIGSAGQVNLGDTFSATLSYDTANAGADLNGAANTGLYFISAGANNVVSFTIDGLLFQTANGTGLVAQTFNNAVSTLSNNTDLLAVQSGTINLPALWSATQATATIGIADPNGNALPNDQLPLTVSPLFSQGSIQLFFSQGATVNGNNIAGLFIEGTFTIAAVPEPTSMIALLTTCMFATRCVLSRRSRRRLSPPPTNA